MEDTSGIASLSPEATTNSTASIMIPLSAAATPQTESSPSSPAFSPPQNQQQPQMDAPSSSTPFPNSPGQAEAEVPTGERTILLHDLRAMLRQQLEYYFSRENLATDAYLRSQMDGDQYVPIATIAKFNQIRRLTEDLSLIVEALRESPCVQVDEAGEKVRPSQRSIVLILREIPESTPIKDLEDLFSGENCPRFSRCEFAHNDTWYVLFDTDEDAKKAYCYLREVAKTFNGKPIMARIKASLTSAPYSHSYKNGVVSPPSSTSSEPYNSPQQMPQPQQSTPQQPQQQAQQPPPQQQPPQQQQQAHVQYTYANVPNESYNNQQICPPFYPPTMLQAWAPTTAACVDLGTVLQMNGLSPQPSYRPIGSANKTNYSGRDRQMKAYNLQQSYVSRSDQNSRYYNNRSQSFIPRQQQQTQQQQQPSFHNLMNTNSCGFDYMPYGSNSRSVQFGFDMNVFAPANFCLRRMPQSHSSYQTQQTRPSTLLLPRNQMAVSTLNSQDQSYIPVCSAVPYPKDSPNQVTGISKHNSDMQGKETWGSNQKPRNKRWSKESGTTNSSRQFPENSNGFSSSNKSVNGNEVKSESPKFDLETASFPPLPGCLDTDVLEVDVYESRLSDIVKGTVKPSTRDSKTQTAETSMNSCTLMKDSSTLTIEDAGVSPDGAFPPTACNVVHDGGSATAELVGSQDKAADWREEQPALSSVFGDNCLCSSNSISTMTQTLSESVALATVNSDSMSTVSSSSATSPRPPLLVPMLSHSSSPDVVPTEAPEKHLKAKSKQLPDAAVPPKTKPQDLQSPKSKTPESSRTKMEPKDNKVTLPPRSRVVPPTYPSKAIESSSTKERLLDSTSSSPAEGPAKGSCSDAFSPKDKSAQGHYLKSRAFDLPKANKGPETESLLSVNGHVDSESTLSSEDEKRCRKLTYSEVALRAKDKVEKLAQELKEKEKRQEAMVRHHRQQEIVTQGKQVAARGPCRETALRRVSERPTSGSSRDWRERRKPTPSVSLSLPEQ